jgi:hypothetical protein
MAKVNKVTDPAEAALSAIEEALKTPATGTDGRPVVPKLPKAAMPKSGGKAQKPVEETVVAPAATEATILQPPPAANAPEIAQP